MKLVSRILIGISALAVGFLIYATPVTFADDPNTVKLQVPIGSLKEVTVCEKDNSQVDSVNDQAPLQCNGIARLLNEGYLWIIRTAGIVAVIVLMVGGFQWMTARGDAGAVKKANKTISNALIGLGLLLGSYVILYTINPNLIQFRSLSLVPIKKVTLDLKEADYQTNADGSPSEYKSDCEKTYTSGVPLYCQGDPAWGGGNMARSGCGITSAAMVASFYLQKTVTPSQVLGYSGGSTSVAWGPVASNLGLKFEFMGGAEVFDRVDTLVQSGKPVLLYAGAGSIFTNNKHWVVITGYNNGSYVIRDPNGGKVTQATKEQILFRAPSGDNWSFPQFAYLGT